MLTFILICYVKFYEDRSCHVLWAMKGLIWTVHDDIIIFNNTLNISRYLS